jgi:hypothetical protein
MFPPAIAFSLLSNFKAHQACTYFSGEIWYTYFNRQTRNSLLTLLSLFGPSVSDDFYNFSQLALEVAPVVLRLYFTQRWNNAIDGDQFFIGVMILL